MKKVTITGGIPGYSLGGSYEWSNPQDTSSPVVKIQGNGRGWAKVTKGSVVINGVPGRTTVEISGPGGWYIEGTEKIG